MSTPMSDPAPERGTDSKPGLLRRLKARVVPEMPDFYALLVRQCSVTAEGTTRLVEFLRDDDPAKGQEVRRLEHEGDRVKATNLDTLHRSFATPMDREDFYDAVAAIDEILNYAKTCVREVEILEIRPDDRMVELAALVDAGARTLRAGFEQLERDPEAADRFGNQARKTERKIENVYRHALATLFDPDQPEGDTLLIVTEMLKRREIYRHLSNAGDQVAHAAQLLEDIVAKAT
jgi:uncharacterized protein Yka (UPF0111/DUF47 family)